MQKTNVRVVPVTAEINGEVVVVGEASLVASGVDNEATIAVELHLDTPEGLSMQTMLNQGIETAISVSSDKAELIHKVVEQNIKHKKENPDDGRTED